MNHASTPEPVRDHSRDAYLKYCCEISRVPLLTRKEEQELARRIQQGDETAREHLITANLRLVVHLARSYEGLGLPLLDLISEGNIGLMKAVDRFDPAREAKLSTYATWWIKHAIRRALVNDSRLVRVPAHLVEKIHRVRRAENRLTVLLGREPSVDELADELELPVKTILKIRAASHGTVALERESEDGPSDGLMSQLSDPNGERPGDELEKKSDVGLVNEAFATLSEREVFVLRERYGLRDGAERTLREISQRLGLTSERVRQLQKKAVDKLRRTVVKSEKSVLGNPASWIVA